MATKDECAAALERLAGKLSGLDERDRAENPFERTVSCTVPDLRVVFHGTLREARLHGIVAYADGVKAPAAQIRLTIASDDLIGLVDGALSFVPAWTAGRIKVNGSFGDLLRLRKIF